ncbi:MAG: hypothetical protein NVSMB24_26440 [Mucilaginibacter sp.]
MKNSYLIIIVFIDLLVASAGYGQGVKDLTSLKFSVAEAPEWSDLLTKKSGWFGGDGIFTIPFNGVESRQANTRDSVLFIFSDTMVGEIKDNTLMPGYKMIHNSVAILNGNAPLKNRMKFYWDKDSKGDAESVFIPRTPQTGQSDYYWLGDGFANQALGNSIYIFGYRIKNISTDAFGFKEVGNTLIKIPAGSKPPFKNAEQRDTPFFLTDKKGDSGSFGAGIYVNTKQAGAPHPDGYIYVYGVKGLAKSLLVARVLPKDFENFSKWSYWNGKVWVANMHAAADVTDRVSNELSLSPLPDGRYALVFQLSGMSTIVGMRIGASPKGPFGPVIRLWDCKPDLTEKTFIVYNAKAHPSLSKPGELLISYNVNSIEFIKDLKLHPNLYRPRFIRVKFE